MTKGTIHEFKVKGVRSNYPNSFYIIEVEGKEYAIRMFPSQVKAPVPEKISCLVQDNDGTPVFVQDTSVIIKKRYPIGSIHSFKVRSELPNTEFYEVLDDDGIHARLKKPKDQILFPGQAVRCKVESVKRIMVFLSLDKQKVEPVFYSFDQFAELINATHAQKLWMKQFLSGTDLFEDVLRQLHEKNPMWVLNAVYIVSNHLSEWLLQASQSDIKLLKLYRFICLTILERTDFLVNYGNEKQTHEEKLSHIVNTLDDYIKAFKKIEDGSAEEYIENILANLRASGYIYEPERRLQVLIYIYALNPEMTTKFMDELFDVIAKSNHENWEQEPFRSAFIRMLRIYIHHLQDKADHIYDIGFQGNEKVLMNIIRAILVILLLSEDMTTVNRPLYIARFYRYASVITRSNQLLETALQALFADGSLGFELRWQALDSIRQLCYSRISVPVRPFLNDMAIYEGDRAMVCVSKDTMQISPNIRAKSCQNRLPEWVLPWHHFQLATNDDGFRRQVSRQSRDTKEWRRMWVELERDLFDVRVGHVDRHPRKLSPDVQQEVEIYVTGWHASLDKRGYPLFTARIYSEQYEGNGLLSANDFIAYGVREVNLDTFTDPDNNMPFLLRTKVKGSDKNGLLRFDSTGLVSDWVREEYRVGDTLRALVTKTTPGGYLAITEDGFACRILTTEELRPDEVVDVEITLFGRGANIDAELIGRSDNRDDMDQLSCFNELIYKYAGGKTLPDKSADDDEQEDAAFLQSALPERNVRELIHIIDRKSMIVKSRIDAYNLLSYAKILAMVIDDRRMATLFEKRLRIIDMMQQYAINRKINMDDYRLYFRESISALEAYPEIFDRAMQIHALSLVGQTGANEELMTMSNRKDLKTASDIAALVLAYNLQKPFQLTEASHEIRTKFESLLEIDEDKPTLPNLGLEEGMTIEFKQSMIYPPDNNMKPDKYGMGKRLMKVVGSMMNTQGGTLYIGVDDAGNVTGLAEDFAYLCGSQIYDEQKAKDVMHNEMSNLLDRTFHTLASSVICSYNTSEGQLYMTVQIPSAKQLVDVDGQYYYRVGPTIHVMTTTEVVRRKASLK